ncbi:MAG: transcription termination/antitermination NusG family protein [Chthoniobacteraceae bacterium]
MLNEPPPDEISWFCLQSQPKREHIAAAHLRQFPQIEVFSPRLRFKRPTTRGVRWFEESMFPGYLFARFQFETRYKEIRSAMGISRILQFGGSFAKIDDAVIESLRLQAGNDEVAVIHTGVKEGDTVKIVSGSLGGLEAVVTQVLSGKERVRLLLTFLGREVRAEVSTSAILGDKRHPLSR